jgi:hypothetical protein
MAASSLRLSKTYLGAQFRRLRTRLGAPIAIKAMAAKLARLVYRMLRYGMKYVDQGAALYQAQHRHSQIRQLKRKAATSDTNSSNFPRLKNQPYSGVSEEEERRSCRGRKKRRSKPKNESHHDDVYRSSGWEPCCGGVPDLPADLDKARK